MFKFYSRESESLKEVKKKEMEVQKDYIIVQISKEEPVRTNMLFLTLLNETGKKDLSDIMKTFFPYSENKKFPEIYKDFIVSDYKSFKRSVGEDELENIHQLVRTSY